MRDYGKVYQSFWSSETIRELSDDGRMLALYLMTSPHTTITGTFRLPDGYACEDLRWDAARVAKGFRELFANGFANRCETTKWVWISKHLEWNPPENPNQRKSAAKVAQSIPDVCDWKPAFMRVCGPSIGLEAPKIGNPSETLGEPFLNQEQEQEQKKDQDQELNAAPHARSPQTPPASSSTTSPAGRACLLLRQAGCTKVNPSHVDLLAALAEGVTPEVLADTYRENPTASNPFAYALQVARRRHAEGAKPLPANKPPGLREMQASATQSRTLQAINRLDQVVSHAQQRTDARLAAPRAENGDAETALPGPRRTAIGRGD